MSRISHTALLLATATWPQAGRICGRNSAIRHGHNVALLQNLHLLMPPTLSPNFKLARMHHHFKTELSVNSSSITLLSLQKSSTCAGFDNELSCFELIHILYIYDIRIVRASAFIVIDLAR